VSALWAVVLAGGDGARVEALTRGPAGERVPKQYFTFGTGEPAVRWAVHRASSIVPRSRILVVVAAQHRRYWSQCLSGLPPENIVVQPRNRGTAPGILLPVLDILLRRDRHARVLVLPADHHVDSEDVLRTALERAARAARGPGGPLVLLGMPGEPGDQDHGWIVPAASSRKGPQPVLAFVEKPDLATSRELLADGALVNSFMFASAGRTLVQLYEDVLPSLLLAFVPVVLAGRKDADVRALYESISTSDFSRAVLERASSKLRVLAAPSCGWMDLGTRVRLEQFLRRASHPASAGRGFPPRHGPDRGPSALVERAEIAPTG
jgi:mannose-1-phosphate guanylyltransferase